MKKSLKLVVNFFVFAFIVIAALTTLYLVKSNQETPVDILFYRFDCPHCKIVDEFITENNITEKIEFEHLEITKPVNQAKILSISKICDIGQDSLGVPLYYDAKEKKCYLGDQPIIDYLKLKLNIEVNQISVLPVSSIPSVNN